MSEEQIQVPEVQTQPTEATQETPQAQAKPEVKGDTPQWVQPKIDKLTRQKHDRDSEIERLKAENNTLRGQVPEKTRDDFGNDEEFITHQVSNQVNSILETKQQEQTQAQEAHVRQEEATKRYVERVQSLKDEIPDYQAVVGASTVPIPDDTISFIQESPEGPKVAYHLAKNPSDAMALHGMDERSRDRYLMRLEISLGQTKLNPPTNPPAPQMETSAGGGVVSLDQMSMNDFVKARRQRK